MEILFMSAGIVVAIVLAVVGIVKLPFGAFKEKHPNWYKAIFTVVSFILAVGLSVLNQIYILGGSLLSLDFAILICAVFGGVFGSYNAYEGLGLKALVKKIAESIKQAKSIAHDKKVTDFLNKIDFENIDKAIALLEERKNHPKEIIEDIKGE